MVLSWRVVPLLGFASLLHAQGDATSLPPWTVYSTTVANQTPVASFPMPVSALRYEPGVDLQARNLAEAQSDITIEGGIFEGTGIRVGANSLVDPQTAHYAAEIPVAPAMLSTPRIFTGADNAAAALNATAGSIDYTWRPITTGGSATLGAGSNRFSVEDIYAAQSNPDGYGGHIASDIDYASSRSDGAVAFGDDHFTRVNGRVQVSDASSQTDFFAGYQAKFFGWPNLYTPFNSDETENLETLLFQVNYRRDLGNGSFLDAGFFDRRNKDDYAYDRFAPLGPIHPYQHTTRSRGLALDGIQNMDTWGVAYRAEATGDNLQSTSLIYGHYHTRTLAKLSLVPQFAWTGGNDARWLARAGVTYDDSNRTGGSTSPVVALSRNSATGLLRQIDLSYAQSTQLPDYTALNSSPTSGLFRGNANLGREIARNIELGATVMVAGWQPRVSIFYRRDDSLVDWTFLRGVTARTANAMNLDTTGVSAVVRRSWSKFDVVLGYSWLTKDADYRGAPVDASFYALNYARDRLTLAITARLGSGWELRMDNEARLQADNFLRNIGGNEALLSSLGIFFRPPSVRGLQFSVQADNLWNSDFQEVPSVPAAPRRLVAEVAYTW